MGQDGNACLVGLAQHNLVKGSHCKPEASHPPVDQHYIDTDALILQQVFVIGEFDCLHTIVSDELP